MHIEKYFCVCQKIERVKYYFKQKPAINRIKKAVAEICATGSLQVVDWLQLKCI